MKNDWHSIFTTQYDYTAQLIKAILEDNEIKCIIISKKDSAYLFGEIELFVAPDDVMKAKQILKRENFD